MKFKKLFTGVSGGLLTLSVGIGFAATSEQTTAASGPKDLELEEVIVTSERVTKDLQKVSQVITVKTGEDLKKEGKVRLDEIMQGVTGVLLQSDNVDTNIYMRGISNTAGTGGVQLLLDGIAQGNGASFRGTTLDIAQVEISRGVQNAAGVTSLTGAVSLVTNKPVFEYQGSGSLTVGSQNLRNVEGTLNLPISSNQAVRMAFSGDRRNGYYANDAGNSDNRQFRLKYRWKPTDNLDITATMQENRTDGNGVSVASLQYTGHYVDATAGENLTFTNPYNGQVSVWGPNQASTNWLTRQDYVNAANASATISTPTLSTANQFFYPAGPCTINTVTNAAGTITGGAAFSPTGTVTGLGPLATTLGCPVRQYVVRDGIYWNQRSDPWNDGLRPNQWPNNPSRSTLQRQANVVIEWSTKAGKLTVQPAYVYNANNFIEPAMTNSWMEQAGYPSKSERLDVQFANNPGTKLQWIAGFNGSHNDKVDDGSPTGFVTVSGPTSGWTAGTAGMSANLTNSTSPSNTNCFTVLPTGATSRGISNSTNCRSNNYGAGTEAYNFGLSFQANYSVLEKLRLIGSVRNDWYGSELRPAGIASMVDGDGTRYIWVMPATNYVAASAANPNGLFQVPYKMILSDADEYAATHAYDVRRRTSTSSYTFNVEYDVLPNAMAYAKYATGTSAPGMGIIAGPAYTVALPDAKYPVFGGNAAASSVALNGTPYTVTGTLPAQFVDGEKTNQIALGLKSRWWDNKLQVNIEAFHNKYENRSMTLLANLYSFASTASGAPTCTANATTPFIAVLGATLDQSCFASNTASFTGSMLARGVDMDVTFVPTAADRLDMSVEFLRSTFEGAAGLPTLTAADVQSFSTGTNAALAQTFADGFNSFLPGYTGQTLQNSPKWSINAGYQHQFRLPNGGRLTPELRWYWKTAVHFQDSLQLMQSNNARFLESNWAIAQDRWDPYVQLGYSLFDFNMSYQSADGKWQLNGYVKNIQNRATLASVNGLTSIQFGSIANNDLTTIVTGGNANLNPPRTIGLTLSANF